MYSYMNTIHVHYLEWATHIHVQYTYMYNILQYTCTIYCSIHVQYIAVYMYNYTANGVQTSSDKMTIIM